ncbi:hypothetical protein ANO14919_028700 [Xylariales sp. No.14919]|nr:hypothetical protein ANO14919_028700 [Xylariales sp. No.14919]
MNSPLDFSSIKDAASSSEIMIQFIALEMKSA